MMKYIDAEKLKAEIERRRLSNRYIDTEGYEAELFEIINSLQQEQPEVDEIIKSAEDHAYFAGQEKLREKLLKWLDEMHEKNKGFSDVELVVTLDKLKEKINSL